MRRTDSYNCGRSAWDIQRWIGRPHRGGDCSATLTLEILVLIELAIGDNCDESRLMRVLSARTVHPVTLVELRTRLHHLEKLGHAQLEGYRYSMLLRAARFSITRTGRAALADHAESLASVVGEARAALLFRR